MSILPLIKFGLGRWKIAVAGASVIYSCGALEARWHLGCVLYSLTVPLRAGRCESLPHRSHMTGSDGERKHLYKPQFIELLEYC